MRTARLMLFVLVSGSLTACGAGGGTRKFTDFQLPSFKTNTVATLAPLVDYGAGSGFGEVGGHTVLAGDTLTRLAAQYRVSVAELAALNNLTRAANLRPGARLKIPAPSTYTVRAGDHVAALARLFNVDGADLVRVNKLAAPYKLNVGQVLTLPRRLVRPEGVPVYAARDPVIARDRAWPAAAPMPRVAVAPVKQIATVPAPGVQRVTYQVPQSWSAAAARAHLQSASLNVPPRPVMPSAPAALPPEAPPVARQNVSLKMPEPPARMGRFLQPVEGQIVSRYGGKSDGRYNEGVNIAAPRGTPVRAAEHGTIVYVGRDVAGYGNLILVKHADGYITAYAHLDKTLAREGQVVKRGQPIGTVGSTGHVDRAQLHFEIRQGRDSVDPATLI